MEQALALYGTLKAQSRTDSSVRAAVTRMEPLVNTRKAPHQTKLQRQKAKAKTLASLAAAAPSPPVAAPSAAPETPATPAPSVPNGASAPPAATHS